MKIFKILTAVVAVCGLLFLSFSCSSTSSTTSTTKTIISTVKTGNLEVSITGTGNLAYAKTEKLAFDMAGYVEEVLVSAGDTVEEGQELVKLNTSDWEDQIVSLETKLTSAQRNLASAERTIGAKELAVTQAQLELQTAQYNLNNIGVVKTAQDVIDKIETSIAFAENMVRVPDEDMNYWRNRIDTLETQLKEAQSNLKEVLSGNGINISTNVVIQIAEDQLKVEQTTRAVEDAQLAVINAQLDQVDAASAVQDAKDTLDEANSLNPIIKAPFAGYITKVNVSGGDEIQKGTVAVQIADPDQFEADILVTENDIYSVKLGGDAAVSLDALSDLTFPAKITKIAPTATVSSGVVNYNVVVTLTSLAANSNSQLQSQSATGTAIASSASGPGAVQGSTGGIVAPFSPDTASIPSADVASSPSATITLKDGLSATVKIISAKANNVLIIPSKAITIKGQSYSVQVVKETTTETREVKIGITDGTNTVITDGLIAGEQIAYTTKSSSSTSSSNNNVVIPGVGGGGLPPGGGF